jgi:hypothetical protein
MAFLHDSNVCPAAEWRMLALHAAYAIHQSSNRTGASYAFSEPVFTREEMWATKK